MSIAASDSFSRWARGDAARFQADFDIFLHGQPGEQRKTLEHHRHAFGGAVDSACRAK